MPVAIPRLPAPPPGTDAAMQAWANEVCRLLERFMAEALRDFQTIGNPAIIPPATVAELTSATAPKFRPLTPQQGGSALVFCTNAASGAIPCFNDGTNWRRVDDRTVVT